MAHGNVSEIIPAPSQAVFDLLHDYSRRLEWDTLLQAAYLDEGANVAAKGVTSVCVGRKSLGSLALKTVYVAFDRPKVAAVKMVNAPALFQSWAASIRHEDISDQESRITYQFHFTTKPAILQFILDPLLERIFVWETRKRLHALQAFFTRSHNPAESHIART
jgi:Polyketide cyclase / dehydrase and lipid transport